MRPTLNVRSSPVVTSIDAWDVENSAQVTWPLCPSRQVSSLSSWNKWTLVSQHVLFHTMVQTAFQMLDLSLKQWSNMLSLKQLTKYVHKNMNDQIIYVKYPAWTLKHIWTLKQQHHILKPESLAHVMQTI